jgi:hypothetical protein
MRFAPGDHNTLDGYVFIDLAHARRWLAGPYVDRKATRLEEVEVGEMHRCKWCEGTGYRQSVKPIRRLTVAEFLASDFTDA